MLISKEVTAAMNAQVGSELAASNQYIIIASYFDSEQLPELAEFFFRQSDEERMHALKFVHYVLEAGGEVSIPAIDATPQTLDSAENAVKAALDWELEVTSQINNIMDLATITSPRASCAGSSMNNWKRFPRWTTCWGSFAERAHSCSWLRITSFDGVTHMRRKQAPSKSVHLRSTPQLLV